MVLIDGKATAAHILNEITEKVAEMVARGEKRPHLAAVLVGNDGASRTYVDNKEKACKQVGFGSSVVYLPEDTSQKELLDVVRGLNSNPFVDGIIVQLPLPAHINELAVIQAIDPAKDVDGFHIESTGRLFLGLPTFYPATPQGIMTLLKEYDIQTKGKHCVVIGRSNIVGRPIANLLSQKDEYGDCTVTICHSRTPDIAKFTRDADIIIAAIGSPKFVKADMVKEGAVIIDVGITRVPDNSARGYHIEGDVDFENVAPKCSYISPVPGGVGPMTIVSLMQNTLKTIEMKEIYKKHRS